MHRTQCHNRWLWRCNKLVLLWCCRHCAWELCTLPTKVYLVFFPFIIIFQPPRHLPWQSALKMLIYGGAIVTPNWTMVVSACQCLGCQFNTVDCGTLSTCHGFPFIAVFALWRCKKYPTLHATICVHTTTHCGLGTSTGMYNDSTILHTKVPMPFLIGLCHWCWAEVQKLRNVFHATILKKWSRNPTKLCRMAAGSYCTRFLDLFA